MREDSFPQPLRVCLTSFYTREGAKRSVDATPDYPVRQDIRTSNYEPESGSPLSAFAKARRRILCAAEALTGFSRLPARLRQLAEKSHSSPQRVCCRFTRHSLAPNGRVWADKERKNYAFRINEKCFHFITFPKISKRILSVALPDA
jgi:hypothetical protein